MNTCRTLLLYISKRRKHTEGLLRAWRPHLFLRARRTLRQAGCRAISALYAQTSLHLPQAHSRSKLRHKP